MQSAELVCGGSRRVSWVLLIPLLFSVHFLKFTQKPGKWRLQNPKWHSKFQTFRPWTPLTIAPLALPNTCSLEKCVYTREISWVRSNHSDTKFSLSISDSFSFWIDWKLFLIHHIDCKCFQGSANKCHKSETILSSIFLNGARLKLVYLLINACLGDRPWPITACVRPIYKTYLAK